MGIPEQLLVRSVSAVQSHMTYPSFPRPERASMLNGFG